MKTTAYALVLAGILSIVIPGASLAAPQVSATSVWTDGPTLVYGNDLKGDLEYTVLAPTPEMNDADLKASLGRFLAGKGEPAPVPAAGTRWAKASSTDDNTVFLNLTEMRNVRVGLLYLRKGGEVGRGYLLNAPEVWGANPARCKAGDVLTVWGANVSRRYGLVDGGGNVVAVMTAYRGYGHSGRYEEQFYNLVELPTNLSAGRYRLYNWGGIGDCGWSAEPLSIEVRAREKAPTVFNVRSYGAKGDGVADDTAALEKAMAAAGKRGGRVYIPSGHYAVTRTLNVPAGVTLFGDGRESTTIETSRYADFVSPFPEDALQKPPADYKYDPERNYWEKNGRKYIARTQYPIDWLPQFDDQSVLLRLQDRSGLEGITLDSSSTSGIVIMALVGGVAGSPMEDVVISRCRFVSFRSGLEGAWPFWRYTTGVEVASPLRYFKFTQNEFQVNSAGITFLPAAHWDGDISFNRFAPLDPHVANVALGVGGERILFQGNIFEDTGRGKTGGAVYYSPRPVWRNLYLHNIFRNLRKSDGEILLYETGSSPAWGTATVAGPDSLTSTGASWTANRWKDSRVIIVAGPGLGQVRWISGNTADTLKTDKPWTAQPGPGSKFNIMSQESLENLMLGNEAFDSHQWSGVYGTSVRNLWVNEVMERVGGGHYLWKIHGIRQQSLNLHLGGRNHERACLAIVNDRYDNDRKLSDLDMPQVFGNEVRHSAYRQPTFLSTHNGPDGGVGVARSKVQSGIGNPLTPVLGEVAGIGIYDSLAHPSYADADDVKLDSLPVSTRWNLFADNLFQECPVGIRIGRRVEKSILWNNTYSDCTVPLQDAGLGTMEQGAVVGKAFQER